MKEKEGYNNEEQAVVLVKHNLRTNTIESYIKEFKDNESFRIYRRKNNVILFHNILSFSPEDKRRVTKTMLKDVAQKFIELRAPNCLSLAVAHLEKEHKHIHIISSGVQVNGRSSRVSKQEFKRILNQLEAYQQKKYPELVYSKNTHEKKTFLERVKQIDRLKQSRENKKSLIYTNLEKAFQQSKSQKDFEQAISTKGYEKYYRNGRLQGLLIDGKKFRLSTLGFDLKELKDSEQTLAKEQSSLLQLSNLRNKEAQEREILKADESIKENQPKELETEFESIQSIRRKGKSLEGLERGMGNNSPRRLETV